MKRKISVVDYDKLIFAKLDYMLALAKLMVQEQRFYNALYETKRIKHLEKIPQTA